jgi:hypothetical protein
MRRQSSAIALCADSVQRAPHCAALPIVIAANGVLIASATAIMPQRWPRPEMARATIAETSQAVEHRPAAANGRLRTGHTACVATDSRESPYYKRLIGRPINPLRLLLQLAFQAPRSRAGKQSCFPLLGGKRGRAGLPGNCGNLFDQFETSKAAVTKSTTEKSESAYKLRVFAKQQYQLVLRFPATCRRFPRGPASALAS